jgi:hypothetical protein
MNKIQLYVGYVGITRSGDRVEIVDFVWDAIYRWEGDNNNNYVWSGMYRSDNSPSPQDIVGPWVEPWVEPVNYNDGNWYSWNGDACPTQEKSLIEYVWHDKKVGILKDTSEQGDNRKSINWSQVVAFRVLEPAELHIEV